MLSLPYKQPEKWAAFSPKPSDSVGFFHIVACSLNSLIFSLPFANCVIIQGGAPPGHFEMLLFSLLYFTIFIPNDCHGNKLSPFHEHTTYVKMDQKKQKHSLFWSECMWLLPLHSLALLLSYQITVCIPQYPFKQQNKQQAFFPPSPHLHCTLDFVVCIPIRLRDLTLSPAASVSPYTALHKHSFLSPLHSLQRLKSVATPVMENCLSGHGRSSWLIESIATSWDFCFGISNQAAQNGQLDCRHCPESGTMRWSINASVRPMH